MYTPLNYDKLNLIAGTYTPSSVKGRNNKAFEYWFRSLFQRACSVYEFTLPKAWEGSVRDFFLYCIMRFGYVCVFRDSERGIVFQPANLTGFDFYYQPVTAVISNPALKTSLELKLGEDGEILKLTPDYRGLFDVIDYYADKLAKLDPALNSAIINSKFAWILGAKNKHAAEAIKKALDNVNKGDPAVVLDMALANDAASKSEPWQLIDFGSIKEKYITDRILMDMQTVLNSFDAEIGISTVPYQKKERMVTSEADSKEEDAKSRAIVFMEAFNSSAEKVIELYPELSGQLEIKMRETENKEVSEDGEDNPVWPS